jgi:uncharacterized surface protein with fasciclin (FAS1) repeats
MRKLVLLVVLCLLATAVVPAFAQTTGTIVDVADSNANLNTLVSAVVAAGLSDELSAAGPFTVFAPTDSAFRNLPTATLEALNSDVNALRDLLLYHVVAGTVDPAAVTGANSLQGGGLSFSTVGNRTRVNGSANIISSVQASNGVIYLIDAVLTPQAAVVATAATTTTTPATTTVVVDDPAAFVAPAAPAVPEGAVAQTGLNERVVIVGPAPVYIDPVTHPGQVIPSGLGPTLCQSVYITEILGSYAKLRDTYNGWIPTSAFVYPAGAPC